MKDPKNPKKNKKSTSTVKPRKAADAPSTPGGSGGFSLAKEPVAEAVEQQEAHKFELGGNAADAPVSGPTPASPDASTPAYEDLGELPQSYSEDVVYLIARDPHWLFTYWDIDWSKYVSEVQGKAVTLRLLAEDGSELESVVVNPYARNWYLAAPAQDSMFQTEIGFTGRDGEWRSVCTSQLAYVPAVEMAAEGEEGSDFASLPLHLSFQHLLDTVKGAMTAGESLIETLARLQKEGADLAPEWTDSRRKILESLLGREVVERLSLSSGSIDDVLRQQLQESLSSVPAGRGGVELKKMPETALTSLSSAIGASWSAQPFSESEDRSFFMHVNAEVIFYGGTDPDATVWIDGKEIELEPDGTFRYHFVYPDGRYEVPIVAQSPDGKERRSATLRFQRQTARVGDVGHTAQPPLESPIGSL